MLKKKVAIAGATGFIGRHLGARLRKDNHVIGLSRVPPIGASVASEIADEWRPADLLSLLQAERALDGVDCAYYLVHSMMPSARLTQGDFWDFDLIVADNFARAAKKAGVKQIIYLGGIVPGRNALSKHLQSRYEVEQALRTYETPVTALRAGLVVGAEGSSFLAMVKTLERLPILLCPDWADTLTHPIALQDVVELLSFCLHREETYNKAFDIGGPDLMSYRTMMTELANALGKKPLRASLPIAGTSIIQFIITRLSGAPAALVKPLVDSLKYPIVARERKLNAMAGIRGIGFREAATQAIAELRQKNAREPKIESHLPIAFQKGRAQAVISTVRSVQRFLLPRGQTAEWVARKYLSWLPVGLRWFLHVEVENDEIFKISLRAARKYPLLILQRSIDRSWPDRWLFYIRGGLLARPGEHERLEFREVLSKRFVLAAIHDFTPRLPWPLYLATQARLHLWVMRSFQRYLERL